MQRHPDIRVIPMFHPATFRSQRILLEPKERAKNNFQPSADGASRRPLQGMLRIGPAASAVGSRRCTNPEEVIPAFLRTNHIPYTSHPAF